MSHARPITRRLFALVAAYVIFQCVWWASLLIRLRGEYRDLSMRAGFELEEVAQTGYERFQRMIAGEGAVFLALLVWGLWSIWRISEREQRQAARERNFMLAVTHELKTPIAVMRLAYETLQRAKLSETDRHSLLAEAQAALGRLESRINAILQSARVHRGAEVAHSESFDPEEVLARCIRQLRVPPFAERTIELTGPSEPQGLVTGDVEALELAWTNLIENALKYSPSDRPVHVHYSASNRYLTVHVDDAGAGIAAADRRAVLKPFRRLGDEVKRSTEGTGLGLYLAQAIVHMHKGRLHIGTSPQGGTRITTTIPLKA
jgi:two-component system, OmpR family, sensor histidine kinase CiaH